MGQRCRWLAMLVNSPKKTLLVQNKPKTEEWPILAATHSRKMERK